MGSAVISPCGLYRYRLERHFGSGKTACVVMVNPSTADADEDDATIRKLRGFAERAGIGRVIVVNLFAYRATDVKRLRKVSDPIGLLNEVHVTNAIEDADILIAAWGPLSKQPARYRSQWQMVQRHAQRLGKPLHAIGTAKCGHPRHPLMTPYSQPIQLWSPS